MNWDEVKGNWKTFKGKAKEAWGKLSDDEITEIAGKRDVLIGKLQKHYGYTRERAEEEADNFRRSLGGSPGASTGISSS